MDPSYDDADLIPTVEAARDGDPLAFEALVRRFRRPLASYAYVLLRDRGYAEDTVQEALLLAYREIPRIRRPGRFSSWIFSIVENAALSGRRARRRRPFLPLRDEDAVAEGPGAEGPPWEPGEVPEEKGLDESRPEVQALRSSLGRIPPHYAQALRLHYMDGLSSREMAAALGLTRNNAKMRLRRARRALRRDLAGSGAILEPAEAPR
jgi:RNA polymerase sigma-70 factor (ECF subfamily)